MEESTSDSEEYQSKQASNEEENSDEYSNAESPTAETQELPPSLRDNEKRRLPLGSSLSQVPNKQFMGRVGINFNSPTTSLTSATITVAPS